jgi:CubicO group peptidase (beta-lactamase class C family)
MEMTDIWSVRQLWRRDTARQDITSGNGFREGSSRPVGENTAIRSSYDSGLRLRARDMAKLAWRMADGGRWRGRQVVPAQWVAESMRPRIAASVQAPPITDIAYGYLWFTGTMHGRAVIWAWGHGAQSALMVPSLDLVVATLADNPSSKELREQNAQVMGLVAQIVELAS